MRSVSITSSQLDGRSAQVTAQFCSDKMDLEEVMKWCDDKLHAIYSNSA
jgi:hypothetical protein